MIEANLTEANLEDTKNFDTADTSGAIFCRTTLPDGWKNNSGCQAIETVDIFDKEVHSVGGVFAVNLPRLILCS